MKTIGELKPTNLVEQRLVNVAIRKGIEIGVEIYIDEPTDVFIIKNLYFSTNYENDFNGKRELLAFISKHGCSMSWNVLNKRLRVVDKQIRMCGI